jgi:nitrogen fixation/metabolism regulation signal transduction histidine kinase
VGYFFVAISITVIIGLIIVGIYFFLKKRNLLKLKIKLLLIFISFLLIPTIPLIFVTTTLITRNVNMWTNARIENALQSALKISDDLSAKTQNEVKNIISTLHIIQQMHLFKNPVNILLWSISSGIIIIFIVIGIWVIYVVSKKIEHPIYQLVQGANRVAKGELGYQIQVKAESEIATLVDSFNKMSSDLVTQQKVIKETERLKVSQEMARRVSHEIKNTLTPIEISIDRLNDRLDDKKELDCLKIIKEEATNLKQLANEFSEFARLPELKLEQCDLNEVVKGTIESYSEHIIEANYSEENLQCFIDKYAIRRAITNLIKNGIEAGGKISINIKKKEDWAIIMISDTGKGISSDIQAQIFNPYFTTKSKGTGLGLAIVKKIILEHSGEIDINSEEGKGTTVVIKLPLNR